MTKKRKYNKKQIELPARRRVTSCKMFQIVWERNWSKLKRDCAVHREFTLNENKLSEKKNDLESEILFKYVHWSGFDDFNDIF